ncbi:MAG: creatininase [bacterium]|jgi:creatinine amidohydrolase
MTEKTTAMTEMAWTEFAAQKDNSIIALCVGSVEQHGPHLPLSVDLLIPYHLTLQLGETEPVITAPPLHYAYRSSPATGGGQSFPGTTALSGETLILLVRDILNDFVRQGIRKFLIMNGHFENTAFIGEAAQLVTAVRPDVKVVIVNWWDIVKAKTLETLFPTGFPGWEVEHASLTETSLIMHYRPDLVRTEMIPDQKGEKHQPGPLVYPEPKGLVPASGILFTANGASAAIGAALAEEIVKSVKEIIKAEFGN